MRALRSAQLPEKKYTRTDLFICTRHSRNTHGVRKMPCGSPAIARLREFPRLGILPAHISGVGHQHQQALAAIEKASAKEVTPQEAHHWAKNDVDETETNFALAHHHACAERGIMVGMVDEALERGIGMMNEIAAQMAHRGLHLHVLVYIAQLELRGAAFHQAQLRIGIVPAMPDPAPEVEIAAVHGVSGELGRLGRLHYAGYVRRELRADLFVGIKRENPLAVRLLQR